MNLIKIGNTIINLDQVTEVDLGREYEQGLGVQLWYVGGSAHFKSQEEAAALRHYFTQRSDDVMAEYQGHLETIGAKKKQAERDTRFTTFCKEKGLEGDDRYYYKLWVDADGMTEEEAEPGEKSLKAWRSWQLENFNQGISEMAKTYSLSDKQVNDFRTYCAEHEGYTRPTHSDYGMWCQLQKYPAI